MFRAAGRFRSVSFSSLSPGPEASACLRFSYHVVGCRVNGIAVRVRGKPANPIGLLDLRQRRAQLRHQGWIALRRSFAVP